MKNQVKLEDRKSELEHLRMALNMCELGVNYIHTDLIVRVSEKVKELGGEFSVKDAATVYLEWEKYWDNYFKKQEEK